METPVGDVIDFDLLDTSMRLAYFSPLPPSKSGIADYSAELLPFLARGAEVTAFVDQAREGRDGIGDQIDVQLAVHFDEIDRDAPFDLCLYHQGNNPAHDYIYDRALRTPGLLILHEHCLHHLITWRTLGQGDEEAYRREMFHAYGRIGARMAVNRRRAIFSEYQQFLLPLNHRLVNRSLGIIVHNEYAVSQLESLRPGIPVEVVPHHLSPVALEMDGVDPLDCRRSLGLPEDAFLVASFGFVSEPKRIPVVLRAFQRLLRVMPNARYLIVGEDHWKHQAQPLVEQMGLRHAVRITGYVTEKDFYRYLRAIDVLVNLRYPTAGETSGTLIRSLGAGKPVLVTDFGQFRDLPDEVCLKVPLGPQEEVELAQRLRTLAYQPRFREGLGQRAAEWARRECAVERSAERYLDLARRLVETRRPARPLVETESALDFPAEPLLRFSEAEGQAALDDASGFFADRPEAIGYLRTHGRRLLETLRLTPVGHPRARILELSSYLQLPALLHRHAQYGEILVTNWWEGPPPTKEMSLRHAQTGETLHFRMHNVDVERQPLPFPDGSIDVVLCCELIEHLREDPMQMLLEIHRVLTWGGRLILTTPNIASAHSVEALRAGNSPYIYGQYNRRHPSDRHAREYTPGDVRAALESAGLLVEHLETRDMWHETREELLRQLDRTRVPRAWRGDNIFAVGRKLTHKLVRYPEELYD